MSTSLAEKVELSAVDYAEVEHEEALDHYRDISNRYSPHSQEYRQAWDALAIAEWDLARETVLARIASGEIKVELEPGETIEDIEVVERCEAEYSEILFEIQFERDDDDDFMEPDPEYADDLAKNWIPSVADPADWTQEELEQAALESRNDIASERGRDSASHASERTMQNFVRHCLSDYESILSALEGTPNLPASYTLVRKKIDESVEEFLSEIGDPVEGDAGTLNEELASER